MATMVVAFWLVILRWLCRFFDRHEVHAAHRAFAGFGIGFCAFAAHHAFVLHKDLLESILDSYTCIISNNNQKRFAQIKIHKIIIEASYAAHKDIGYKHHLSRQ
jgi:hypothetical protein